MSLRFFEQSITALPKDLNSPVSDFESLAISGILWLALVLLRLQLTQSTEIRRDAEKNQGSDHFSQSLLTTETQRTELPRKSELGHHPADTSRNTGPRMLVFALHLRKVSNPLVTDSLHGLKLLAEKAIMNMNITYAGNNQ